MVIHEAFVEGNLEAPKHLARTVRDLYFALTGIVPGQKSASRRSVEFK